MTEITHSSIGKSAHFLVTVGTANTARFLITVVTGNIAHFLISVATGNTVHFLITVATGNTVHFLVTVGTANTARFLTTVATGNAVHFLATDGTTNSVRHNRKHPGQHLTTHSQTGSISTLYAGTEFCNNISRFFWRSHFPATTFTFITSMSGLR